MDVSLQGNTKAGKIGKGVRLCSPLFSRFLFKPSAVIAASRELGPPDWARKRALLAKP